MKSVILFIILLFSVEAFTARPSLPIQKTISLNEKCSTEFLAWLGLNFNDFKNGVEFPTVKGEWTKDGLKTETVSNFMKPDSSNNKILTLGNDWWDLSTAIPRRAGPRFQFQSPQVESIKNFSKFWSTVSSKLQLEKPEINRPFGAGRILFEKNLCQSKSFSLLLTLVESPDGEIITGSGGTPGAPRLKYSMLLRAGEPIEEFKSEGFQ